MDVNPAQDDESKYSQQAEIMRPEPAQARIRAWFHQPRPGLTSKFSTLTAIVVVALIIACFGAQVYAHVRQPSPASGPRSVTPTPSVSPAVMIVSASPTTAATATSSSPDTSSAIILIQAKRVHFRSGSTVDSTEILIDPNVSVRVATDGTGQVAGFVKTFYFNPPTSGAPLASGGVSAAMDTSGPQPYYYVPSSCVNETQYARGNATEGLNTQIDAYKRLTNGDAQQMASMTSPSYPTAYDQGNIVCLPAAGYRQSTAFDYVTSMKAHVTLPWFRVSDVLAYRQQQAIVHAPPNFAFEEIDGSCNNPYIAMVSATAVDYRCDVMGYYRWNWTQQIGRMLASQIAGKDPATAMTILANYAGADIYKSQGISFQLVGSSSLPRDPSKITFKVYDSVLIGTNGVQTTGTPQIVP